MIEWLACSSFRFNCFSFIREGGLGLENEQRKKIVAFKKSLKSDCDTVY
jgi:hypothetical protein